VAKAYLVAGCKSWSRTTYDDISKEKGEWRFVGSRDEMNADLVRRFAPRYIFFLHWSWKVPEEIVNSYECVCFHMTDVPYGRGGSPLQNLIVRGHRETRLTALRMTSEIDAGPVYSKAPLSLEGNAEEIYIRAARLSATMVERIVRDEPEPVPQKGEVVSFARRKSEESRIAERFSLEQLHDFIRMLDAEGYPAAFIECNGFRFEFSRAALYHRRIIADVKITRVPKEVSEG
jgi:methionyl-tRNA formyltransferase